MSSATTTAPQRFIPFKGQPLTVGHIRGSWRPSGSVAGAGMFAVLWEVAGTTYWAPLHDFEPADQLRLVAECRQLDQRSGVPPIWSKRGV